MVMTTATFKRTVEPILNTHFNGLYNELSQEWTEFTKVETALARSFEEEVSHAGLGVAVVKGQGEAIAEDEGGEAYSTRFQHVVYGLSFPMTEELMEDSEHLRLGSIYSEHLARGMIEAKEIVHANILNNSKTVGANGGDGVPLLSAVHPLYTGATFSNTLASASTLSEANLETLLIKVRTAVDERGKYIGLKPKQLLVSPTNEYNAARILHSMMQSGNANNDINAIKHLGRIPKITQVTRLTQTLGYWIQTDAPRGLICKQRRKLKRGSEGDFLTGTMRYKAHERYATNWVDPRAFFGDLGQ